ncbi:TipC family immunity protein [Streptococcus gallolyticus]|uniref:TipC family immunity protein n=1 Tax=Streptococcus gallolyticus TaxID=315405 RepID=UPI0022843B82|nr:TipC family immunity protein [Streptococcus gallolyticus]MCY7166059.1 TipC family immunity protein [Streptococcus gallolyticus subsp. gallolyticus]MCY7183157.1 TipC family immunity protein [Streptococcus gallolyticus subsp. gallolyticus]
MKKKVFLMLGLVIVVALSGYWFSVYRSLKNPFDEMYYSETESINIVGLPTLSDVVGNQNHYDPVEQVFPILDYDQSLLEAKDNMMVFVVEPIELQFLFKREISDNVYLGIIYTYTVKQRKLSQSIYLSNRTEDENKKTYHGDDLLTQLSAYGKDLNWLQSTSQTVLEDDILGLWFKKGSHRYSLDNLGDLTITYDDVLNDN